MLLLLCGGMLGLLSLLVEARVTVVIVGVLAVWGSLTLTDSRATEEH